MSKIKLIDSFKRDSALLEFIKQHKGKDNKVTSREIADFLNKLGYNTNPNSVHVRINRIMYERNAPICSVNAKGYYWAVSRAEIEETIADIENRRSALKEHIDHLKNFIIE